MFFTSTRPNTLMCLKIVLVFLNHLRDISNTDAGIHWFSITASADEQKV